MYSNQFILVVKHESNIKNINSRLSTIINLNEKQILSVPNVQKIHEEVDNKKGRIRKRRRIR